MYAYNIMGKTRKAGAKKAGANKAGTKRATKTGTGTGSGAVAGLARFVIPKFLEMINTIKIYHWKTSSYATHKATDDLFAGLNTKTDDFVEVLLGKSEINRDKVLVFSGACIKSFSTNVECRRIIEGYKTFLLDLPANKNFKAMANVDLLTIRDEIMVLLNQFLYLLTLY